MPAASGSYAVDVLLTSRIPIWKHYAPLAKKSHGGERGKPRGSISLVAALRFYIGLLRLRLDY